MGTERFEDWSAHHDVPAELALALDFANTVDHRDFGDHRPREFLPDPASLDAWLLHQGFSSPDTSEADFARALALRSGLRDLAEAHGPDSPPIEEAATIELGAFELPLRASVDDRARLTLTGAHEGTRFALARILATVVLAEAGGTWSRAKMCSAPDCRVVFYDGSKAHNSRWCSSTGCGNRMKTRAYRARRRGDTG